MESPRVNVAKRRKRRPVACDRCHSHKIKCSGQRPCSGCIAAKSEIECRFRFRDRLIKVPESTLEGLEAEIRDLKAQIISKAPVQAVQEASTRVSPMASLGEADQTVAEPFPNPLLDIQHGLFSGQESSEPVFVGEAACTAFGDRLLQCVSTKHTDVSCNIMPDHITHPVFGRCMNPTFQLPNRIQATLLIRRVQKFIGTNFHLMLRKSFFAQFDRAYNSRQLPDAQWACHLFALLALGELYSNCNSNPADDRIPGMSWFLIAVRLLQDSYEVASLEQVQVLVLLSHYYNILGRIKSSHVYCGIAIRLAIGLGLHRSPAGSTMSSVHKEHRRRVWWTLYLFDRLTSSKLGYPLSIQDHDIDVELPSMDGLSATEQEDFSDPMHLLQHVRLAKITGSILNDIYCPPKHSKSTFVSRVHRVLNDLRTWDDDLPAELRLHVDGTPRNLYTLHMHYHLCIIQTTRPILLHMFKTRYQTTRDASLPAQKFSQTTHALADSCVQAARTTNSLLSRLFVEGNLAVFGYFDAHYIFSSTLILIISTVMEPATVISDAVQTAFNLLTAMAGNGNVSAKDYLSRLQHIRSTVGRARAEVEQRNATAATLQRMSCEGSMGSLASTEEERPNEQDWDFSETLLPEEDFSGEDPLGNPFIESFLAEKAFEWPGGCSSPEQEFLRQFARELEDEFVFSM